MINNEVDLLLATSHRVVEVLKAHGLDDSKMAVAYAGTRAAEHFPNAELRKELQTQGELTICYLGYMRRDKGFYFLLDTLESCPADLKSRIRLVLGAKTSDPETMNRLIALSDQMADIIHFDGYTHEQLSTILDGVDVGMVPVQWEDNLPQVATEMVAHGVPIITSHRGGAKELGGENAAFIFNSSSKEELIEIWRRLAEGELQPGDYWSSAMSLTTMEDHLNRLMELWANPEAPLEDVRPPVDPSEHKTHIHEVAEPEFEPDEAVGGVHLDALAAVAEDAAGAGQDLDVHDPDTGELVHERGYGEIADSNPAVQAANSIPDAAKEAAVTRATRPAQPLDNEDPNLVIND
jgi:hypothetical protein